MMIIQALLKKGEVRPVLELITTEFDADYGFYRNFWIDPHLSKEGERYVVQVTVPDRQETLARIDPLPEETVAWLQQKLPEVDFHIDTFMVEHGSERRQMIEKPGDVSVRFDFSGLYQKAMGQLNDRDPLACIATLEELKRTQPRLPFVELYIGEAYIHASDYEKAEEYINLELGYRKENFIAYCSLGVLYRVMGKPSKAREAWTKSLKIYRNYLNSLLSMSYLFSEPADLEMLLARARRINPNHPAINQIIEEREMDFGGMNREQVLELIDKKSRKINPAQPIYLPGLSEEGVAIIDPTAGDLTREEVFRFCLEEIIKDGSLDASERETMNNMKSALEITAEEYQLIFKEVQLNYTKPLTTGGDAMNTEELYRRILDKVMADGKISEDEKKLLRTVADVLLIDPEKHRNMIKNVMEAKGFVI
jgi:tetratricopeptide (TPR) repeat protein